MSPYAKAFVVGAIAAASAFVTHAWDERGRVAEVAGLEAAHAKALKQISDRAALASGQALTANETAGRAVATIDQQETKGQSHALEENKRLAAADAAGNGRLRIAASCPAAAGSGGVPAAASTASLDHGTAVEVDPEARRAVWDLRADLIADRSALTALQRYVREVCPGVTP